MSSIFSTVRDLERLRQIVGVLTRHGFGEVMQRSGLGSLLVSKNEDGEVARLNRGERIRRVLTDLGPSAVKMGQIVSTRPDLIPEDIILELKKLQDDVPPVPFAELKQEIEEALGASIADVYEVFDETPLASASIGQVHRATLKTEKGPVEVAVKIQRPHIDDIIERDIDLLYMMARAIERSIPESKLYSPVRLVAEFERAITAELDFNLEADNAVRFARNFEGDRLVKFPDVYKEASSKRVLTIEFLPGLKIYEAVAQGYSAERISKNAVRVIVKQIFEDGFFHADPHPGNVLILGDKAEPTLGMIDLGLVGRLTPQMRDRVIDLMVAVAREDRRAVADALYAIGRPTKKIDREAFEAEVSTLADKYLGKKLAEIEIAALFRDLVGAAMKYEIEVPPDFLMVGKTIMTVEGVGKEIYPQLDVFEEVKPYFLKLFWQRYSPEKVSAELLRLGSRIGVAAADLPVQLQDVLEDLRRGNLVVHTQEKSGTDSFDHLGRRLYSGFVVGSFVIGSAILAANHDYIIAALGLAFAAAWGSGHISLLWFLRKRGKR